MRAFVRVRVFEYEDANEGLPCDEFDEMLGALGLQQGELAPLVKAA